MQTVHHDFKINAQTLALSFDIHVIVQDITAAVAFSILKKWPNTKG